MAGMPLSVYLRQRRLTKAAFNLQNGDKVIDVSLRYGYESPTAFNRAFQAVHGISPSAAQKPDTILKAFPRVRFN
jgi:AraC family transcriptional regulator